MRLDHRCQNMPHLQRGFALRSSRACKPIRRRQNATQIIRRMSPLRRQPCVVEVQPANHRADVERSMNRIKLIARARYACAMRHHRARHNRPHQLRARRVLQRLQPAAQRIHQAMPRCRVRQFALDFITQRILGDIHHHLVRRRPFTARMQRHRNLLILFTAWVPQVSLLRPECTMLTGHSTSSANSAKLLTPLLHRHKLQILRPRVICRWPNNLPILPLLNHVRAPARRPRHHK